MTPCTLHVFMFSLLEESLHHGKEFFTWLWAATLSLLHHDCRPFHSSSSLLSWGLWLVNGSWWCHQSFPFTVHSYLWSWAPFCSISITLLAHNPQCNVLIIAVTLFTFIYFVGNGLSRRIHWTVEFNHRHLEMGGNLDICQCIEKDIELMVPKRCL